MELRRIEPVIVNRRKAYELLEQFPYVRQRDVSGRQVEHYADLMRNGLWQPFSDLEVAYAPNGDGSEHGHLINGQHRLHAVIEADLEVQFVIKHVGCVDDEEMALRYGTVDTGRARTPADFARAIDLAHETGFREYQINQLTSAMRAIGARFRGHGRYTVSVFERFDMIRAYVREIRLYNIYTSGSVTAINMQMRRSFPLGLALVTIRESAETYGEEKIKHFWQHIALGKGFTVDDPRKLAHDHFVEAAMGAQGKLDRISPEYTARYIANCFNAWAEDRPLVSTRVDNRSAPIKILGSHFTGRE